MPAFFSSAAKGVGGAFFRGVGGAACGGFAFERDGLEHQRLGEERAADAGLLAHGADAEGGEALGADEAAAFEQEERCFFFVIFFRRGGLHDDGAKLGDGAHDPVGERLHGFYFLPLGVEGGGFFELHAGGGLFAFEADGDDHALAAGVEEFFYGCGFGGVLLGRAGLFAGRDALVHLAVDAAGMLGVGSEVFMAAAEFEEVEDGVAVPLGGEAGGEGAVHLGEAALGELVGGVDAGEGVLHGHAEEVRGVELEAAAGFDVSEEGGGGVVEDERGFEGGAGDAVLDACDFVAEVEAFGLRLGRVEETPHAPAEVGGLGEVGCVFGAWAAEGEDSGLRGDGAKDFVGSLGREV